MVALKFIRNHLLCSMDKPVELPAISKAYFFDFHVFIIFFQKGELGIFTDFLNIKKYTICNLYLCLFLLTYSKNFPAILFLTWKFVVMNYHFASNFHRNHHIYNLHIQGESAEEIGLIFNLEKRRMRQILERHERLIRKINLSEDSPLLNALLDGRVSLRTVNSLIRAGIDVSDDRQIIEALKSGQISVHSVKKLGVKGLAELKEIYLLGRKLKPAAYLYKKAFSFDLRPSGEEFFNITPTVSSCVIESGVTKGYVLVRSINACLSFCISGNKPSDDCKTEKVCVIEGGRLRVVEKMQLLCKVNHGSDSLKIDVMILGENLVPDSESTTP